MPIYYERCKLYIKGIIAFLVCILFNRCTGDAYIRYLQCLADKNQKYVLISYIYTLNDVKSLGTYL